MVQFYTPLVHRGILKVYGEDRRFFLQGLLTNDLYKLSPLRALYAAHLTPQGRFLHDLFLCEIDDTIFIEAEKERLEDLKERFSKFKLRSQVSLEIVSKEWTIFALYGGDVFKSLNLPEERAAAREMFWGAVYVDPRLLTLGARAMLPSLIGKEELEKAGFVQGSFEGYEALRMEQGVPDGSRDMKVEKAIILENGLAELQGIDWKKGCYLGQELTARTYHQGLVRKRLLPVSFEGPALPSETEIYFNESKVGTLKSSFNQKGLALLRLEAVFKSLEEKRPLIALIEEGAHELWVKIPQWVELPKEKPFL